MVIYSQLNCSFQLFQYFNNNNNKMLYKLFIRQVAIVQYQLIDKVAW